MVHTSSMDQECLRNHQPLTILATVARHIAISTAKILYLLSLSAYVQCVTVEAQKITTVAGAVSLALTQATLHARVVLCPLRFSEMFYAMSISFILN